MSPSGKAILRRLRRHGPHTARSLLEALPMARVTVYKALNRLREAGLIELERTEVTGRRHAAVWRAVPGGDR